MRGRSVRKLKGTLSLRISSPSMVSLLGSLRIRLDPLKKEAIFFLKPSTYLLESTTYLTCMPKEPVSRRPWEAVHSPGQ